MGGCLLNHRPRVHGHPPLTESLRLFSVLFLPMFLISPDCPPRAARAGVCFLNSFPGEVQPPLYRPSFPILSLRLPRQCTPRLPFPRLARQRSVALTPLGFSFPLHIFYACVKVRLAGLRKLGRVFPFSVSPSPPPAIISLLALTLGLIVPSAVA